MTTDLVNELQKMIGHGGAEVFDIAPKLLGEILNKRLWADRLDSDGKKFKNFEAFTTHRLWQGLESSISDLLLYCRHHPNVVSAIKAEVGELAQHGGKRNEQVGNTNLIGNTATYILCRLKRDRPDLAAKVVAGEMSANAAAIEAGFRKPPVPLNELRRWWKKATPDERETFRGEIYE